MIDSTATFRAVGENGNYTNEKLIQQVKYEAANPSAMLRFHFEFQKTKRSRAKCFDFRLASVDANKLIADLNGTVSVGYAPTFFDSETVTVGDTGGGLVHVEAATAGAPKHSAPVEFTFKFLATTGGATTLGPFQLTHVDASLLVGLMNAVANTN